MKEYKIVGRILRYKKKHEISYKALGELLGCDGASLHYLLTKSQSSLAFQVTDKFLALEKKSKKDSATEDDAWDD